METGHQTYYSGDRLLGPDDLAIGDARVIRIAGDEREQEAILARTESGFRAYLNRCRHLPVSLDWGDGEVLDESGKLFQCRTHGALYRVTDGHCVAGPCHGADLIPVEIEERESGVYLT